MLRIDCISDTHGLHKELKLPRDGGEILIHAGDCSPPEAELEDVLAFLDWFKEQNYSHRLLVAGNHDNLFELIPELMEKECAKRGIILLNDSGCKLKGYDSEGINIWGSPIHPGLNEWPFSRNRGADIKKHWDLIPKNTEILITHGPPYKIRDEIQAGDHGGHHAGHHAGCQELYKKIIQTSFKLHVFGHVHASAGFTFLDGRLYVNASSNYTRIVKKDNYSPLES